MSERECLTDKRLAQTQISEIDTTMLVNRMNEMQNLLLKLTNTWRASNVLANVSNIIPSSRYVGRRSDNSSDPESNKSISISI